MGRGQARDPHVVAVPAPIALVDCNNFYASCERVFPPELRGKPVVVLSNNDALMEAIDELSAVSDRVMQFRLKKPFPLLPNALGKTGTSMPCIMPQRLAETDPNKQVSEMIGSGPFRFDAIERIPGALLVYERNRDYVPRTDGMPTFTAGPKLVRYDRVEWRVIPDASTAANALAAGEVDWWQSPTPDLQLLLKRDVRSRYYPTIPAMALVMADAPQRCGMNVDLAASDWGTVVQRRSSRKPASEGRWNIFLTNLNGTNNLDPASQLGLRGNGDQAWFGWPTAPRLEQLRHDWFDAATLAEQKLICVEMQRVFFEDPSYLPLGAYYEVTALRKLRDVRTGFPHSTTLARPRRRCYADHDRRRSLRNLL